MSTTRIRSALVHLITRSSFASDVLYDFTLFTLIAHYPRMNVSLPLTTIHNSVFFSYAFLMTTLTIKTVCAKYQLSA